jgi:undecaprenyl-diphosphatase
VIEALSRRGVPPWVDRGFRLITHLGGSLLTIAIALLLLLIPETRYLGRPVALSLLFSFLAAQLIKRRVARRRPSVLLAHIVPLSPLPDPYSFPSGHSCASMSIAASILLVEPMLGIAAVMVAAVVAASRVYLRIHYPTDALVGQLIGAGTALGVWAIL